MKPLRENEMASIFSCIRRNAMLAFSDQAYELSMLLGEVPWRSSGVREVWR